MIIVRGDKLVLPPAAMQQHQNIVSLISGAVVGQREGKPVAVVPFTPDTHRLFTNAGATIPAPVLSQYQWAGDTPFESQKHTAALLTTNRRAYVLSSMGVGKTRAAIYSADYLLSIGEASKVLIVAPLSTLNDVWARELFTIVPAHDRRVLYGSKQKRLSLLAQDATFYIINPEGVVSLKSELAARKWDIVIIDELAAYRNAQTVRWAALKNIVTQAKWAWGLTGSPTPNSPVDAYGQIKLLTPSRAPSSFRRFKLDLMDQVTQFKWEPKPDAAARVHAMMQPSIRYTLDECHDLPPLTYSSRTVDMSDQQAKIYDEMMRTCMAEISAGKITAVNEGVKIQKLLQISAGFMYNEHGKGVWIGSSARIKEMLELVEQAEKKVLIFSAYKWMVNLLAAILNKAGHKTAVITGDVSKRDRDSIFQSFRQPDGYRVISAHPGTMAHGLTLVQASTSIWFGPVGMPDYWNQANARTHRPGQTSHTHVICLQSSDVERRAFNRLRRKQKMEGLLLDMFKGVDDG